MTAVTDIPPSLTRQLVRLIRSKQYDHGDLHMAALFVLDTIACAVGAAYTMPGRILGKVTPPDSRAERYAFHFGGMAHILEMDDLHRGSVTHPGCVVIPAAFALARELDLSGRAFLAAVLAGYEACARVGMAVGPKHYRVWHNTSTCGPFGSAMAAAELLGLNEDQAVWALGNAGTQSCGLWEFLDAGAMSKHLHTARAAEAGIVAARLAREGFTGPDRILEGKKGFFRGLCLDPRPDAVLADAKAPWQLRETSIKPWPCCRHTHPTIDAALALHDRVRAERVGSIWAVHVETYRAALDVCDRSAPADAYSARFSLQHCVAAALADGSVTASSFDNAGRQRLALLANQVSVAEDDAFEARYPTAWGSRVVVVLSNGEKLTETRDQCKGDPANPVNETELVAKATALMAAAGAEARAECLIQAVLALPGDAPVRSIRLYQ
ncbi:MmgE/PrpD family protein (plasmid) [Aminobacter sp. SR38]|nr:MmgE/PrpD family protein [Aminobacter sp. SR38]